MPELTSEQITQSLQYILRETVESPTAGGSAYLDQKTGLYDTLQSLTLEQVFHRPGPGRPSIAQHVAHAAFHINATIPWMRGAGERRDWDSSWVINEPTQATWDAILENFKREHANLREAVAELASANEGAFGGALAAIVHIAYHLGAIRQLALLQTTSS